MTPTITKVEGLFTPLDPFKAAHSRVALTVTDDFVAKIAKLADEENGLKGTLIRFASQNKIDFSQIWETPDDRWLDRIISQVFPVNKPVVWQCETAKYRFYLLIGIDKGQGDSGQATL